MQKREVEDGAEDLRAVPHAPLPTGPSKVKEVFFMKRYGFAALAVLVVMIGMLGYVHERVKVLELSRQIDSLRTERTSLDDMNKRLSVKIARLSRGDRIVKLATERLGMTLSDESPPPLDESWALFRRTVRFFRIQYGWVKSLFMSEKKAVK